MSIQTRVRANALQEEILHLAELVSDGTTERFVCPACYGGSHGEKSLAVTVDGLGYKYFCHRASCGVSGGAYHYPFSPRVEQKAPEPAWRPYPSMHWPITYPMNSGIYRKLAGPLGTENREERDLVEALQWCEILQYNKRESTLVTDRPTLIFTLRSLDGEIRGYHLQRFKVESSDHAENGFVKREAVYTMKSVHGKPIYGHYTPPNAVHGNQWVLWVVEDCISAARLAYRFNVNSVALLGTRMSDEFLKEARQNGFRKIMLCLDRDASMVALEASWRAAQEHNLPVMPVLLPGLDIKDLSADGVEAILRRGDL